MQTKTTTQTGADQEKDFIKKLQEISKTPATRMVRLVTKSCCGCGCTDINIIREVPYDSPLQDGDYTKDLRKGDREV